MADEVGRTSSGLDANVAAALAYALGWVTGILFVATEPANNFVRFHAWQSTIVFGALSVLTLVIPAVLPFLGMLLVVFLVIPISAILWLVMMFKAYQGERFKLPIAGDMAEQRLQ